MQIVIASGKGGTGKTTVASNLAFVLSQKQSITLCDCDVEEPNQEIFFPCDFKVQRVHVEVPLILEEQCVHCGSCGEFCRFGALTVLKDRVLFFPQLCHSCDGCFRVCPTDALKKQQIDVGELLLCNPSDTLSLIIGRLKEGDTRTTAVIRAVRDMIHTVPLVILDSPPGTACPFIETVDAVDLCVLVTESTPFGLHDLSVAVDVLSLLCIRSVVVINRSDGNDKIIEEYCSKHQLPILMRIPFDFKLLCAQNKGLLISQEDSDWFERFSLLGDQILTYSTGAL
jgi:MinD superfamily P-loop ATPase